MVVVVVVVRTVCMIRLSLSVRTRRVHRTRVTKPEWPLFLCTRPPPHHLQRSDGEHLSDRSKGLMETVSGFLRANSTARQLEHRLCTLLPINDGMEQDEINLRNRVHQEATATEASTVRKLHTRRQRRRTRIEIRIRVSVITQKTRETLPKAPRRSTSIRAQFG